jgi:pimeloyl-ACP methyl ester carboxylesterase
MARTKAVPSERMRVPPDGWETKVRAESGDRRRRRQRGTLGEGRVRAESLTTRDRFCWHGAALEDRPVVAWTANWDGGNGRGTRGNEERDHLSRLLRAQELARRHAALIPGARFEIIPGAAHLTTWDAPEVTLRVTREFLRAAETPHLAECSRRSAAQSSLSLAFSAIWCTRRNKSRSGDD